MLPLTFVHPEDYDKVQPTDKVSLLDLKNLAPGKVGSRSLFNRSYYFKVTVVVCQDYVWWRGGQCTRQISQ